VDFLPDLVAPRVGVFVTELGQQTHCAFYLLVFYNLSFICLLHDVRTLDKIYAFCVFNVETSYRIS
jgi:hypothetical protein